MTKEYEVRDRFGSLWWYSTSKAESERKRVELNKTQKSFKPFETKEVEEGT